MIVGANQIEQVVQELKNSPRLCIDCETTGLLQSDRAFGLAIANEKNEYYFDTRVIPNIHINEVIRSLNPMSFVAQNFKFDLRMLDNTWSKPNIKVAEDTEVLGRLVRNDHLSYSLDAQTKRYGMVKMDNTMAYIKKNKLHTMDTTFTGEQVKRLHFEKVPLDIIAPYAANDARVTYDLYTKLITELDPRTSNVWATECVLIPICYGMEKRGILVNADYTLNAYKHEQSLIREAKDQFRLITGLPYDNKKSTLVDIFSKAGEIIPKTDKGNDQLTDEVLESFTSPVAKIVQKIRYHEKRVSTYYSNYLDMKDDEDILHPDMRQAGTTTGRFSYRDPNLQNIPAEEDSEDPYVARGCFMPRAGYVFVAMDYKAQEYMLMLAYAKHHSLIQQVMNGADVHQAMADMVGIKRREAKTLNFACIAEGELVLTHMGLVPIEKVTRLHMIWDGTAFALHGGVVYNGEKEVITFDGLTATSDHKVFTECGRQICFGDAAAQQGKYRIATTEVDGKAVRYIHDNFNNSRPKQKASPYSSHLLLLLKNKMDRLWKYITGAYKKLQMPDKSNVSAIRTTTRKSAEQKVLGSTYPMHFSKSKTMERLWWAWDQSFSFLQRVCSVFYRALHTETNTNIGCRPYKQRRTLRNWEHEINYEVRELKKQTKKVYDILNCGPRNRFTVSGKLVHNCLYGAGAEKISHMLNISVDEATRLRQKYFSRLREVEVFIKEVTRIGKARGYVYNWAGRKLFVNHPDFAYKFPNYIIQGGGADICKAAMLTCNEVLKDFDAFMVLQIHDALYFEMKESDMSVLIPKLVNAMIEVFPEKNGITMKVDVKWSDKSLAERDMKKWILK